MYTHRGALREDFEIITSFPQGENELFHMFPSAVYPLTSIQLEEQTKLRLKPTVVIHNNNSFNPPLVFPKGGFFIQSSLKSIIGDDLLIVHVL